MSHREYLRLRSNIFPQCDYKENEMNEVDIIWNETQSIYSISILACIAWNWKQYVYSFTESYLQAPRKCHTLPPRSESR